MAVLILEWRCHSWPLHADGSFLKGIVPQLPRITHPIHTKFIEKRCAFPSNSAGPWHLLSLLLCTASNPYVLQRQVTELFRLDWMRQPKAPTARDNRGSRSCQVVRLSPTEGLKGHQAKVKYSSHTSVTLCAHWTLPLGSVSRRSLVGNRKCLQA